MGCGVDISKLAPRGAQVNNAAKETSGSVSFMELFSTTTGLIGQNGRRRSFNDNFRYKSSRCRRIYKYKN
jgi:ribonucleotide reductase alpha subunit